ncbi:prpol [Panicum miliaceum]|uniref:Prpol n=1 Tax=Panicum miliaceum TaxID=4540 RepID=A0A3L6TFU6_PANMI|nr:prpol [Panicum miliaceum]
MEHVLKVDPKAKPIRQRLRTMSEERKKAAQAEVQKLLDAGVIHEVQFSEWLANLVMVPKKNGKWRMCIDFTNLNKACPKDDYPLPRIDTLVDAAAGSEMMSMLDYFSGYHQIWMSKEDEAKTSFTTPFSTYCFVRMPEGLY